MNDWATLAAEFASETENLQADERRNFGRDFAPHGARTTLRTHPSAEPTPVALLDLSLTGAGLTAPHALPVNRLVLLEITWSLRRHLVLARIAHCRAGGNGYKIGVEFEEEVAVRDDAQPIPAAWLARFGGTPSKPA